MTLSFVTDHVARVYRSEEGVKGSIRSTYRYRRHEGKHTDTLRARFGEEGEADELRSASRLIERTPSLRILLSRSLPTTNFSLGQRQFRTIVSVLSRIRIGVFDKIRANLVEIGAIFWKYVMC